MIKRTQQQLEIELPPPKATIKRLPLHPPKATIKRLPMPKLCLDGCGLYVPPNGVDKNFVPFPHGPAYDSPPTLPKWEEPLYGGWENVVQRIWNMGRTLNEHFYLIGRDLLYVKKIMRHGDFGSWVNENLFFSERKTQRLMAYAKACMKAGELVPTDKRRWYPKTAKLAGLKKEPQRSFTDLIEFPTEFQAQDIMGRVEQIVNKWLAKDKKGDYGPSWQERRALGVKLQDFAAALIESTAKNFSNYTNTNTSPGWEALAAFRKEVA